MWRTDEPDFCSRIFLRTVGKLHKVQEMKPRHAAALALVGWYLMIPPLQSANRDDPSGPRDLHAPISQWDQVSAYDSAAKCQRDIGKYFFSQA